MTYRETVVRGKVSTRHLVQLFDNPDSLAAGVSEYVREGVPAAPIRRLAARGRPLRVFGEIVDLLADQGDFTSAQQLEDLWNALGESESFELLCGYSAVHFGDPQNADALRGICPSHFQVRSSPPDVLASFLVETYRAEPPVV